MGVWSRANIIRRPGHLWGVADLGRLRGRMVMANARMSVAMGPM